MGIYAELISHDEYYRNTKGVDPIILNYLDNSTEEQKNEINDLLYTTNGEIDKNIPSCQCGNKKGKCYVGSLCDDCHTPVREPIEEYIQNLVWVKQPKGVAPLINIQILVLLRTYFSLGTAGKFDTIAYLTDSNYNYKTVLPMTDKLSKLLKLLEQNNLTKRSYNFFVNNFYTYMDVLFNSPIFKNKASDPPDPLYYFILQNKDKIFSTYVPFPNKSLLIIEKTRYSTYMDLFLTKAIEAARYVIGIDTETADGMSPLMRQNSVSRCLCSLSEFHKCVDKQVLATKPGAIRKSGVASRMAYTFRAVISSLTKPHMYDEIHISWPVAVNVLYNHITAKLLQKGWSPLEAAHFIYKYSLEYNELMDSIFKELIKEAGPKGIPCIMNRNPSLGRGSIQRVYISKIKENPEDITISISILIVNQMNADAAFI